VWFDVDAAVEDAAATVASAQTTTMRAGEMRGARGGAAGGAAGAVDFDMEEATTVDVEVSAVEEVRTDGGDVAEQLVELLDVSALALEVAADTLRRSPAATLAADWLRTRRAAVAPDEQEPAAAAETWRVLRALNADERRADERAQAARRELLDAMTNAVERT
jgi:hypothetical protein